MTIRNCSARTTSLSIFLLILFAFSFIARPSFAYDPPHNGAYQITCASLCHSLASPPPPWRTQPTGTPSIDYTLADNLCWACHSPSYPGPGVMDPDAQDVQTHSSVMTSNTYGTWSIECRICHSPHYQQQVSTYAGTSLNSIVTGTIVSVSQTDDSLTVGTSLTPSAYAGYILVPNIDYPYDMYRITSNDANTISIGNIGNVTFDTFSVRPAATFSIRYSRLIKTQITTPNSGVKSVRFFNNQGPNSFASGTSPVDGVCQVCHTKTKYFNNSGTKLDQGHPAPAGYDCMECHKHSAGFKASCDACHGSPPVRNTKGGPGGLALTSGGTGSTGSTTAGAHARHVNSLAIACSSCHVNSAGSGTTHNNGLRISLGFSLLNGAYTGGAYDGQTTANYDSSDNGLTTVTKTGRKTCSNIYCHGATMAPNGGTDTTPVWDSASTAACGSCHGAAAENPPTRGSHKKHTASVLSLGRSLACTVCHNTGDASKHINGSAEWAFDAGTYPRLSGAQYRGASSGSSATVPSASYGQCSNLYCHSIVQTASGGPLTGLAGEYRTPTWGDQASGACGSCHDADNAHTVGMPQINSGSHAKHLAYAFQTTYQATRCAVCHKLNPTGPFDDCGACHSNEMNLHVNYQIDIAFETAIVGNSAVYNGSSTPGSGFANCSNTYCHSNGTSVAAGAVPANTSAQWGAGTLACSSCHGYPPAYANGNPKANSHPTHVQKTCDKCHAATTTDGATITNTSNHVNRAYDLQAGASTAFSYTFASDGGSCSNISCHPDAYKTGKWGATACLDCHSVSQGNRAAIATQFNGSSHHVQGVALSNTHCYQCHWEANSDGSINTAYHSGSAAPGAAVDLVLYAAGSRPTTYTLGSTAVRYTADGSREETAKINDHCLGCHSEQNNATQPFGDNKTPKQYAWDDTSIDLRYSQTGTTSWGKYASAPNTAKKDLVKSYSSHGNAQNNLGGGLPAASACFGANMTQTVCTEFTGVWDATLLQCNNLTASTCAQEFCSGGSVNQAACQRLNGTWSGTTCRYITPSACTSGFCSSLPPLGYGSWSTCSSLGGQPSWDYSTSTYLCSNISTALCTTSGGVWNAMTGSWKTGGNYSEGVDYALNPTRGGANAKKVLCFDCHNSHGSNAPGTTTNYTSATANGGILKSTTATKGGYSATYTPSSGGSLTDKSAYSAGAGICFDCHLSSSGSSTSPWGYRDTFGASQAILGYWDSPYFGPGAFGSQQRFPYKSTTHQGGHFGASTGISSTPTGTIKGLCTPCHDPHGVSPTIGSCSKPGYYAAASCASAGGAWSASPQYAVPLLKGTFLTSPYKEDNAPSDAGPFLALSGITYYNFDQNSFASGATITENDTQFAGLCISCHAKANLSSGVTHTWKSKDRIHESVKGWKTANGTVQHNYPCSKCHTPHNSQLPRLMATNCLDNKHKGRTSYNGSPVLSTSGSGNAANDQSYCYGDAWGCSYDGNTYGSGSGSGRFPGSYSSNGDHAPGSFNLSCHEGNTGSPIDQGWNSKTPWAVEPPTTITSGPTATPFAALSSSVAATIAWTTNNSSSSFVDYGLTASYGTTTGSSSPVQNHSVALPALVNHSTYHYKVRSVSYTGQAVDSGDRTFYISVPPTVPVLVPLANAACASACTYTLQWSSTDPDSGPIQYTAQASTDAAFASIYTSVSWTTGVSWAISLPTNYTWYWRVQSRDGNHTTAQDLPSGWSTSSFSLQDGLPPSQVVLSAPTNSSTVLSDVGLIWNTVPGPYIQYQAQYSTDPTFNTNVVSSGWITANAWYPAPGPGAYYWRVQARNSLSLATGPASSVWSFTITDGCYGDSCCLYGCSTCPTLYAWDGAKFAFETDTFPTGFLGTKIATGWRKPNPFEYHLLKSIPQLLDGSYEFRIVEERDETDYFDTVKLFTVDYPQNRDVYQEYKIATYVDPATILHTVDKVLQHPVSVIHVNTGEDVSAKVAASDKDYLILNTDRNIGLEWHTLEIDLGDQSLATQIKLILDAQMTVPTTSAGMALANQLAIQGKRTKLEVLDVNGNWVTVPYATKEIPAPKERGNAYIVDITNIFQTKVYKLRVSFLLKTFIDGIYFDTTPDLPVTVTEVPLVSADLGYYGFSEKTDGEIFDYIYGNIVSRDTSFFTGNYTGYGSVTPLLTQTDDKFAIFAGGDQLSLTFGPAGAQADDTARRYLVYANGYYKATGNTDITHTVTPLPFKAMSNFPYDSAVENYPSDAEHNQYLLDYNTRTY